MKSSRLAALAGASTLALCGLVHAAGPAHPSLGESSGAERIAAVQLPAAVGQPAVLRADAVQVAVNTFDATSPAARAAAADGDAIPRNPFSSYLLSATRYVQDVGTFRSPADTTPKKISDAPLPGALWLFGSALLAFLAISVRRKF